MCACVRRVCVYAGLCIVFLECVCVCACVRMSVRACVCALARGCVCFLFFVFSCTQIMAPTLRGVITIMLQCSGARYLQCIFKIMFIYIIFNLFWFCKSVPTTQHAVVFSGVLYGEAKRSVYEVFPNCIRHNRYYA